VGVAGVLVAVAASGDAPTREPVRVEYRSEGQCPSGESFFGEVRARTDKVRGATAGERARALRVEVQEGARESQGSLVIVGADGAASSVRTVRAKTCDDVVRALALVAALAIDPEAKTAPRVDPVPVSSTAQGAPPAPTATALDAGTDAESPDAAPRLPETTSRPGRPAPPEPREPAEPPARTTASLGLALGLEGATVLEARPSPVVVVGLDIARNRLISPWIALRLARSFEGEAATSAGTAKLVFSSAALEACPLRLRVAEPLALFPCGRVAFGFVEAEGAGVTTPASALRGWGDVGLHARAALHLAGPLHLDGHVGARVPLFRDTYFVDTATTLYEIPRVLLAFGGELRVAF
jgi:hypothetical protein